ncbi:MAG: alpha/beta hydrolase [Leptospiraceae bacterium]|nr:alpha/beta hydrolase [Leptospiraceae bacterium]
MNFLKKNGFTSSWEKEGNGKKILFLPGWAESQSVWREICQNNLVNYEKYFLNLGGHFPSEFPSDLNKLTLDKFLESHFELIDHLADNDKLILIGHSTGGFISWMYANTFPEKIEKLILVGSFLEGPISGIVPIIKKLSDWKLSFITDFIFEHYQNSESIFYDAALAVNPSQRESFLKRDDVKIFFPKFFAEYKKMNVKSLRMVVDILDSIRISKLKLKENLPIHFIHGDKDPVIPYSQILNFCNTYETANLITMFDVGHSPHWENPKLFWKKVLEILNKSEVNA